MKKNHFEET